MAELNENLLRSFLETTYFVRVADKCVGGKIGERSEEFDAMLAVRNAKSAMLITAWNPWSERKTDAENAAANGRLKDRIVSEGFEFLPSFNRGAKQDWPDEEGFCVFGVNREDARRFAREFEQHAVVFLKTGQRLSLEFSKLPALPVFVYGTLMRGESREKKWPCAPVSVEPATVDGALVAFPKYPALVEGPGRVAGELRTLAPEDVARTLEVLDRIEGFDQSGADDLYQRQIVECTLASGEERLAYTYFLAARAHSAQMIPPEADGATRWRRRR